MDTVTIVEKNEGRKIAWTQDGTKLTFGDDELMVNAAKRQKDWPVHEDICADDNGNLKIGLGKYYVAQIDIPARAYTEEVLAETEAAESADATSPAEMENTVQREPIPIDMSEVVLTLWSVDGLRNNQ